MAVNAEKRPLKLFCAQNLGTDVKVVSYRIWLPFLGNMAVKTGWDLATLVGGRGEPVLDCLYI